MSFWRHLTHGVRVLTRQTAADQEIADEVQHYVDQSAAAHVARGLSPDQAVRAAQREIGNLTLVREQVRDSGWEHAIGTLVADVRFAARMIRKSPVFSLVVVLLIALGSGAVTTIFSGMNALVLRPLPGVAEPAQLLAIQPARRDGTVAQQGSYAYYAYLRERSRTVHGLVAWGRVSLTISARGEGTAVLGNMVSGNYFGVLGVRPALGRFFAPDEDRTPLTHPVIVVSHGFWRARLAADEAAIGRTVLVNGRPFTVIGVAPEGFRGVYTGIRIDAWAPLMMQPLLRPRSNLTGASWLWLFGRLRDGTGVEAAENELSVLAEARALATGDAARPGAFTAVRASTLTGLPGGESAPCSGS